MTRRYALIGDPVDHSLSPVLQNGWIADHALDATYETMQLKSDDPVAAIRGLTQFAGMNVTVPYKDAAARAADRSEDATANVLRWEADGSLSAFNTDGLGFLDSLDEAEPEWRERVRCALIVGAGGAARGIVSALSPHVETLIVVNRTRAHADALAAATPRAQSLDWTGLRRAFSEADLIVQTTTLGMTGRTSPDWPVEACKAQAIVADIVYRPLETPLLAAAREKGLRTVDGLGMLIHQGARAFEIWFGVRPSTVAARTRLEAALA